MCDIVIFERQLIETPGELKQHLKVDPILSQGYKNINDEACLCQVDLEKTFENHNIQFSYDAGEYHITKMS